MNSSIMNEAVAILLLRTVTGILFFFQGYDKIFNVKIANVTHTFSSPLSKIHIPTSFLKPAIALSSIVELICGLLLFFGLFRNIDLYILSIDMILVAFMFSSMKAMWDMQFYFPRMILIILLLLLYSNFVDVFSVDYLIFRN